MSFGGRLDEMKLWLMSGTTESIHPLAAVSSVGLSPENMASHVNAQFGPSAEYLAAWWRFESISAYEIFSGLADVVDDSTAYGHSATPHNFLGSVDFSEDQSIVFGVSATGDFLALKGGSVDHGGMAIFDNQDGSVVLEEGTHSLVLESSNTWTALGSANLSIDENQIWMGSSGYRVNTVQAGDGATHTINYNNHFLFDSNSYTMGLRLLSSTGSSSARVIFTIGHHSNSAATTAVMKATHWKPIFLTKSVCADGSALAAGVITGSISVQQLHHGGTDAGALFNLDGLFIKEGDFPSKFVRPGRIRKGGQIYWNVGD